MSWPRFWPALFLFCPGLELAQAWTAAELSCVCNSAAQPNSTVLVNADCANLPEPGLQTAARLFYSLDNQSSWSQLEMDRIGTPGYDSTHEQDFAIPGSGTAWYYVRANSGTNYSTQSPWNEAGAWPPGSNLLAEAADEPAGDTINGAQGAWLDLTGIWVGYSSTRFYARLTNNHSSWPHGSFPGPWYIYSVAFKNPDAPSDTYSFAMSYANVMGIYTSGLYEINDHDPEHYTRIGDIQTHTDGNQLSLSCLVSDLLARPRFGPWPNQSGCLETDGTTESATITQQHYRHDSTNKCWFYADRTPVFSIGQNQGPTLSHNRILPDSGTAETEFEFSARYFDQDSNLPLVHAVVVDQETLDLAPNHHRYWAGATFSRIQAGFGPGWHRAWFLFSDGMAQAITPLDSFFVSGTGIEAETPEQPAHLRAAPVPFTTHVNISGQENRPCLEICAPDGRRVCRLGGATVWNGRASDGTMLPAGVYFCRVPERPWIRVRLVKLAN